MEQQRETGVWQRVMAPPGTEPAMGLGALVRESAALEGVYRRTAEQLTGRGRQVAMELLEGERSIREALLGIGQLTGSPQESIRNWEPGKPGQLRGCYRRSCRCRAEYLARSLEPEYGEVYRQLAEQAGRNCGLLARLMGILENNGKR